MRLNLTADVPIGVAQHTMLIAVSYAARPFGVKRIDSVETAKQKCPQIVIAYVETKNNKPNLTRFVSFFVLIGASNSKFIARYRDASVKIFEVLNAAGAKSLERGSVDEAYMDVSNLVDERMARDEAQPSWPLKFEGSVVVAGEDFAGAAAADIDDDLVTDANADRTVCTRLWWGAEISKELRKQIFQKLGYTVSCGVSFNKVTCFIFDRKQR
jgi:DNA polymerase eta